MFNIQLFASYNVNDLATVGQVKTLGTRIAARLTALETPKPFKGVKIANNKLSFYASTDTTVTPITSVSLPEELYLDQTGTTIVENFAFSAVTYPGATNPNLDGKTVLVLAVRGDNADGLNTPTVKYSFVNMGSVFNDAVIKNPSNVQGDFAIFGVSGAIVDSGIASDTFISKVSGATAGNLTAFDSTGGLSDTGITASSIFTTIGGFSAGNVMIFDPSGKVADSGHSICSDSDFSAMLDDVLPTVTGS